MTLESSEPEAGDTAAVLLLGDIRDAMGDANHVYSDELLPFLHELDERPWATWSRQSDPIRAQQVARLLRHFDIKPTQINRGPRPGRKGYLREHCEDAWARYCSRNVETSPDSQGNAAALVPKPADPGFGPRTPPEPTRAGFVSTFRLGTGRSWELPPRPQRLRSQECTNLKKNHQEIS